MLPYTLVTSAEQLGQVANALASAPVAGLDIETTGHTGNPFEGEVRLVQLNTGAHPPWVIDLFQTKTLGPVADVLRKQKTIIVGQNLKHEQKFLLHHLGIELWPIFDTFRASELLHNGRNHLGHNLYDLYRRELKIEPEAPELGFSDWSGTLTEDQLRYAAEDVTHLLSLYKALRPQLQQKGLFAVALIEFGAILPEAVVETNGFPLDQAQWLALAESNEVLAKQLRDELLWEMPSPKDQLALPGFTPSFNLDSPIQMLESFRRLGIRDLEDTREMTLAMHASKYPLLLKFFKYREVSKQLSSFGPEYLQHINPKTGCIHTSYWPFTGAGRYASSKPNLQQIPRDPRFRKCFVAEDGQVFILADYSNIEMRLVAEISGDPVLIAVFQRGEDAHYATASLLTGKPKAEISKKERQEAKPVNFGFIYGMQAPKLVLYAQSSYGVTLSLQKAKEFREKFFHAYRGIARWHEERIAQGAKDKCSWTLAGRLRYLDPEEAHNEFYNCLDADTEALTTRGWVKGFELSKADILLTKNPDTAKLEWQPMTDLKLWPDYQGKLVEFRSRSFSAISTPNHRWLVWNKTSGKDECRTTDQLSVYGDHRIHRTGEYDGPQTATYSDDFIELCGWFLTDGTYIELERKRGPDKPSVRLYQSARANPHKVAQIDALLDRMRLKYGRYYYEKHGEVVRWQLDSEISGQLHELFPLRTLTGPFLSALTTEQAHLLLDTMMKGDGSIDPLSGKESFVCRAREAAGMFQFLVTLCGRASSLHERDMSKYTPKSEKLQNVPRMGVHQVVNILRRDKVQVIAEQRREFEAVQPVWCPIVPNTFFVARREGHVFITGNTPVQGSGADGLKAALRCVYLRLKKYGGTGHKDDPFKVKMRHHVHDEIILSAPKADLEVQKAAAEDLSKGMHEGVTQFMKRVPVEIEAITGSSWAAK